MISRNFCDKMVRVIRLNFRNVHFQCVTQLLNWFHEKCWNQSLWLQYWQQLKPVIIDDDITKLHSSFYTHYIYHLRLSNHHLSELYSFMTHETLASLSNHPEINQVEELIRNLFTQEVKIGGFIRISKMSKNRTIDFFKKNYQT